MAEGEVPTDEVEAGISHQVTEYRTFISEAKGPPTDNKLVLSALQPAWLRVVVCIGRLAEAGQHGCLLGAGASGAAGIVVLVKMDDENLSGYSLKPHRDAEKNERSVKAEPFLAQLADPYRFLARKIATARSK